MDDNIGTDDLINALNSIVNTARPNDRAIALKKYSEILLTDDALAIISKNIKRANEEEDHEAENVLKHIQSLLQLSREQGLEAGLNMLKNEYLNQTLRAFVESTSWAEKKNSLIEHKDILLSESATQLIETLFEMNKDNQAASTLINNAAMMLDIAREKGVEGSIRWVQDQLLAHLSMALSNEDIERGELRIKDLNLLLEENDWLSISVRIADIAFGYANAKGETALDWSVSTINEMIKQAPTPMHRASLNLHIAHLLLSIENEDKIEQAITRFYSVIEDYTNAGAKFSGVYGDFGRAFLERGNGNPEDNLERAKEFLEKELQTSRKEKNPENWAVTHRLLGKVHDELGYQKQAFEHLKKGLSIDPVQPDSGYAQAAKLLSELRLKQQEDGRQVDFDKAIDDLKKAEANASGDSILWARIQLHLGDVFRRRLSNDPEKDFKNAFEHTNNALRVFKREEHEDEWAQIQHNLGTIYYADVRGDRSDNIENAINCYKRALEVHNSEDYPQYYGLTTSSLAMALMKRVQGNSETNMKAALDYFKESEATLDPEDSKTWLAECFTGMGSIYRYIALPDRYENLLLSEKYMQKALQAYYEMGNTEREIESLSNLAAVYSELQEFDKGASLKAVEYAEEAVKRTSREANPYGWAIYSRNLAAALINQENLDETARRRALEYIQDSLEIFTKKTYLTEYRLSQAYLGHIHFLGQSFEDAFEAYNLSIKAGEELLATAYTEPGKKAEVQETELAHIRATYCLVKLNRLDEALIMLESGKTRILSETLAFSDIELAGIPSELAAQMRKAREKVRLLEGLMRPSPKQPIVDTAETGKKLRNARSLLNELAIEVKTYSSHFDGRLKSISEIVDQIPKDGGLVAFAVTTLGTIIFIVESNAKNLNPLNIVEIPDFTSERLNMLLDGREPHSWVSLIQATTGITTPEQFQQWLDIQSKFMNDLWANLIDPVYDRFPKLGIKPKSSLLLLPQGGLWFLAIHAASREINGKQQTLAEDYNVIYAPSIYTRKVCLARLEEKKAGPKSLLAVVNPGGDLDFSDQEASLISKYFENPVLLHGKEATRRKVLELVADANYLHFACHGTHDWEDVMYSGLELAHPDKLLLSGILAELSLNSTRLVTLSACETGITDLQEAPDEFVGLPTGFLLAGTAGVISTIWKVDDIATCLLMSKFYENLNRSISPHKALKEAQKWLRELTVDAIKEFTHIDGEIIIQRYQGWLGKLSSDDRIFDNAFFWAGFIFVGA